MSQRTNHLRGRIEYKILARILRDLRIAADIPQETLGKTIGRGRAYIWKIENEVQLPDLVAMLDIIEATGGDAPAVIAQVQEKAGRKKKKR